MLKTIDRYVLREVLPPFLLGLLVFSFILEIPPIMAYAESLIAKGVPWPTIGRILLTLLPQALGITIPIALLIGLLVGLGRLSGDRELVALQACGISVLRLGRPVALLSIAATLATLYVLIVAIPDANQTFREITYRIVSARAEGEIRPRVFFEDFPHRVLYVRDIPAGGTGWTDVMLADTERPEEPVIYVSRRGRVLLDRDARLVQFVLEDGTQHRFSRDGTYRRIQFDRQIINLDADSVFPRHGVQRGENEMRIPELRELAAHLEAHGESPHRPILAIHQKFSIPVACLVFGVLALALGVSNRKDGKLASFALGIAVVFAYYVVMYMAEALAKGQLMPPAWARWIPNLVLGAVGVAALAWRARSTEGRLPFSLPIPIRRREPQHVTVRPPGAPPDRRVVVVIRIPPIRFPRPSILDGYVSRLYLRVFALAFVGLVGIFYISTFIDLSDKLFRGETTGRQLLTYFWFQAPQFVYFVLPLAALLGTLVTVGLLTRTSELVVMKACGISLYRAAAPLVLFGAVWSGALFALEESILAQANRRAEELNDAIRSRPPRTRDLLNRRWIVSRDGHIYHYNYFDRHAARISGLTILEFDRADWRLTRRTWVAHAAFDGTWTGRDGWTLTFDGAAPPDYQTFERRALALEPPEYFTTEQPDSELMTYRELKRYIAELQASGFDVVPYAVDLQRKISFPFVTIVMTLLAIPFAVMTGRKGALYSIGVGVVLALAYWTLLSVFGAVGSAGMLAPVLAAWAPNLLFGAGAGFLLLTVRT